MVSLFPFTASEFSVVSPQASLTWAAQSLFTKPLSMRNISSFMWRRGLGPFVTVSDFPCLGSLLLSKSPGRMSALLLAFSRTHFGMSSSLRSPSQCGSSSPAVGATRVRFTLLALNAAITGPFLSSRFLSRVGVSLSMSGSLRLGSPLSSRGTAQSGLMLIVCGNIQAI